MNRFAHLALAGRYGRDFALGTPQARYGFAIAVLSVLRILKGSRNRGELDRPLDQEDSTVTVAIAWFLVVERPHGFEPNYTPNTENPPGGLTRAGD